MAKTDYKWSVELYPDATNYDCDSVLESLDSAFTHWAYIMHDMDVHEETGELKKSHIHVVGIRLTEKGENSPCGKDTVCNALGIPANYIEPCKSVNAMVRYLVHADNPEKYQYDRKQIQSNFSIDKYFKDRADDAKKIADYIIANRPQTVSEVCMWAFENKCYSDFRRGFMIWNNMIKEQRAMPFEIKY